jgi:putative tricarboxylic transport membrane protein
MKLSEKIMANKGEVAFTLLFTVFALVWIAGSLELPLWAGFAPESGFLPLIYGAILLVLCAAVLVTTLRGPVDPDAEREPTRKSWMLLGALVITVASFGFIGFVIPLFLMSLFMYAYVERLSLITSTVVSAVTTGVLVLVFAHWLAIPIPLMPWSF